MRIPHLLLLALSATCATAQDSLRVMAYNLLHFPDPVPAGRADTLAHILAWHPVDILITEEMRTAEGAQSVLDEALNVNGTDRFSMAEFVSQQSDPGELVKIAQMLYYDHEKLGLQEQHIVLTTVRDLNVYTLYLRDAGLLQGDTTFLTVVGVHLKSSTGYESEREAEALLLREHLSTLPAGRMVIIGGDMNLYTGAEPAFTALLTPQGTVNMEDPLNLGGADWYGAANAWVHTQSTRYSTIYSDGSGGGMDDRFDILLLSNGLMDGTGPMHLVPGSYKPLGNSGTCYNQSITECDATQTPFEILRSLYFMSDHLPITLTLAPGTGVGIHGNATPQVVAMSVREHALWITGGHGTARVELHDASGRLLLTRAMNLQRAGTSLTLPEGLHGFVVASVRGEDGGATARLLIPE
jgi:endonuclease/exonuclease/phosphatase family metal-dependent hydrolase